MWGCSYGVEKPNISEKGDPVEFDPFLLYAGVTCSGAPDLADLEQLAKIRLRRGMSASLANQLLQSHPDVGNPDLVTLASDITPLGGAPCMNNAIAGLMTTAQGCGGGELTFHAPIVALASLMQYDLVEFADGKYRLGGHTIIVDLYENIGPAGSPVAGANEVYIYATGPVEYKLGATIDISHFTGRTNEGIVLAEQLAIMRFDPCCVYAIRAEIC